MYFIFFGYLCQCLFCEYSFSNIEVTNLTYTSNLLSQVFEKILSKEYIMKKLILTAGLLTIGLMATDFTQLSTEELAALRGTVAVEDRASYREELQGRLASLTQEEREAFMSKKGKEGHKRSRNKAMDVLNGKFGTDHEMQHDKSNNHHAGDDESDDRENSEHDNENHGNEGHGEGKR